MADQPDPVVTPVVAEQLVVHADAQPTHGVRVHRQLETHSETIDMPVKQEQVDIRRVMKNEVVDGPLPVRREENLLIVPVVEEEIVVTRRFVLKEEVHIRTSTVEKRHTETVEVSRQHAEVEHLDQDGNVTRVEPEGSRSLLDPGLKPKPTTKQLLNADRPAKAVNTPSAKPQLGGRIPALDPKRTPRG